MIFYIGYTFNYEYPVILLPLLKVVTYTLELKALKITYLDF